MNSEQRKKGVLMALVESSQPLTGAELAEKFNVTRQIIVQDIALLRAEKNSIVSTARGYMVQKSSSEKFKRTAMVCHNSEKIEDELKIIVDLGGHILTTAIDHPIYGILGEALNIKSRRDIDIFLKRIHETGCEPLLSLTRGIHKHTIEADSEDIMNEIFEALNSAGYLIS